MNAIQPATPPTTRSTMPPRPVSDDNPFPGLRSFEPDEDHLFFGRETQVDQLLTLLRRTRFLAVVGTSGSGKSSLIRSGLVPSLHSGFMTTAGSSWRVAIFRPGENPIGNLAAALSDPEVLAPDDASGPEDQAMNRAILEATLHRGDLGLVECRRRAPIPAEDNLLIIADQFEELFRFKENRCLKNAAEASTAFVKLLLEAAAQDTVPVYVVLTMRSEFVGHCTEFAGFAENINRGQFLIPRMSRQERRLAILGPVAISGAEISPRLLTRLLNDVGEDPDQLPILQHALMRTWDDWRHKHTPGEPLDLQHYEAIGTLSEALSQHAEEAFGELDENQQKIAERMFKALTEQGAEGRGVRSPRRLEELAQLTGDDPEELIAVVECFRLPGRTFLMPPHGVELDADSILDISHESLMRVWKRLRLWVDDEARSAQIYRRVSKAAERHQREKGGLWRDPDLQMALNWRQQNRPTELWAEGYDPSFQRAMAFLDASRHERDLELRQREERRRRQLTWMRRVALFAAGAALLMALLGLYALNLRSDAEQRRLEAVEERKVAEQERVKAEDQERLAEQRRGEAEEAKKIAEQERKEAEIQEAKAETQRHKAERLKKIAEEQRQAAEEQEKIADRQRDKAEEQRTFAEKNRVLAEESLRKTEVAKKRAEREEQRAEARRQQARAKARAEQSLRLPEDQRAQATRTAMEAYRQYHEAQQHLDEADALEAEYEPSLYSALYQAWTWHAQNGQDTAHQGASYFTSLSSETQSSETQSSETQSSGTPYSETLRTANHHDDAVRVVAIAPRGDLLASADDHGGVHLTALHQSGTVPDTKVADLPSAVRALAWSPDGRYLAAGTYEGSIHLWTFNVQGNQEARDWTGIVCEPPTQCRIEALLFTHDSETTPDGGALTLLSASSDGAIRFWNQGPDSTLTGAGEPLLETDGEAVVDLALADDGRTLAAALEGGIRLWTQKGGWRRPTTLELGPENQLRSLAIRHDGHSLVAGTEEGSLLFWDLDAGAVQPNIQRAHKAPITAVDFAVHQNLLASASLDGSVRLWRLNQDKLPDQEPIDLQDHEGWVWDVTLTADGNHVISGGADRKILVRPTSASPLFDVLSRRTQAPSLSP